MGVDTDEGQRWFLQTLLWPCGTGSAQPSGASAPTFNSADPVWSGVKGQDDGSMDEVPTAEAQGLCSRPPAPKEKNWVW